MKKILALTSCAVLLSGSVAMAAGITTGGGVTAEAASVYGGINQTDAEGATSTLIGKLSKGVKLGANYGTAGYALTAKHSSGNTRYGTAHDATAIYRQEIGTTGLAAPTAPGSSAFATDWTAM